MSELQLLGMEDSEENGEDNMQETSNWSRDRWLVKDSGKDGGGEYEIDSGSERETFDDDYIELEYEEIERGGNEDQWDDEGEKGLDLVVMEDKEVGLDDEGEKRLDEETSLDDDHKQTMKKLKRMDRDKWKMKNPTFKHFDMESDLRTVKLKVGQIFGNAKLFKEAAREHAISQGRSIWFPCNEKSRVQCVCKCKLDNCSWTIWTSCYEKNSPSLMIKTLNDKHTCPRVQKNRLTNSAWLTKRYTEALRPGKEFKMFDFLGKVRKDYVCQPSKAQVYRAKRKAGLLKEGILATQYAKLWDYAEQIRRSNPSSIVVIDTEEELDKSVMFRRIYICLEACKVGWISSCKPIIGLNAYHTKGNKKSQLMFAIGIDTDNSYYPITYTIVEKECYMIWFWFLSLLKVDLKLDKDFGITFMTDKQKVARATIVEDFSKVITQIEDMNEEAHEWLCEKHAHQWSKSHFRDWPKCDMLLNNLCESINGDRVILEAMSAPIFSMLEMIRVKSMNPRANRRIDMEKWYHYIGHRVAKFMELQAQDNGQFVAH
ncbi:hypothetical protein Dsin_015711 [Dipteronia sinensis]|uniref:Transposase MuDR plant domain-containing protein n=1 Tax=Dipteronia sinensis TaxID=43782 RepID=A0AAE0ABR0_9ROSI|nr:hypothetical protein Dsin_015711 [Dipteronia sinensis]